jgi:general secretion pathway protein H
MPRDRYPGFTLVEVLVVVALISIAAAFVTVNLYGDDRRMAEREARRMAGALEHAAALAQWRGEVLGVSADGSGYRFWRRGADGRWTAVQDDDVLVPHALPATWTVAPLSFASAPVAPDAIIPFRPSGRNEPYELLLASPAWSLVIAGDPLNRVALAAPPASR